MWGKKSKQIEEEATIVSNTTEISVQTAPPVKVAASVISSQAVISGNILTSGDLAIDGRIEGNVNCAILTIGSNGLIIGDIKAETATIRGKVTGNVTARTILLAGTGSIDGDLTHSVLIIEEGGTFEGRSKRRADPLAEENLAIESKVETNEEAAAPVEPTIVEKSEEDLIPKSLKEAFAV